MPLIGGFVLIEDTESVKHRKLYNKEYNRKYRMYINGKCIPVEKRPRPNNCEICKKVPQRLDYHHWDDTHPEVGLWLCKMCHDMAEQVDKGLDSIYRELKCSIDGVHKYT